MVTSPAQFCTNPRRGFASIVANCAFETNERMVAPSMLHDVPLLQRDLLEPLVADAREILGGSFLACAKADRLGLCCRLEVLVPVNAMLSLGDGRAVSLPSGVTCHPFWVAVPLAHPDRLREVLRTVVDQHGVVADPDEVVVEVLDLDP